jgi:hypothetical protein
MAGYPTANRYMTIWRWLICLTGSLLILIIFIKDPRIDGYSKAMVGDMIYGRAHKPFVCRMLLPLTARVITQMVPDPAKVWLYTTIGSAPRVQAIFRQYRWQMKYLVEYLVAFSLIYACLVGFFWSLRRLCQELYLAPSLFYDGLALLALLGLPIMFRHYNYLYDMPTLFLFTLGLALLAASRWFFFTLVYLAGCFNKETTILLSGVFWLHYRQAAKLPKKSFWQLLLLQLLLFLLVRLVIAGLFAENPGEFLQFRIFEHNLALLKAYSWPTGLAVLTLFLLVARKWSEKPLFLRDAIWILPPLLGLTCLFGWLEELRDYYEAYPIIVLLLAPTLAEILGYSSHPRDSLGVGSIRKQTGADPAQA